MATGAHDGRMSRTRTLFAASVVLLTGCSGGSSTSASPATATPPGTSATSATSATSEGGASEVASVAPKVSKLMVVVLENRSRAQALAQMPYLASQADRYGQATRYYAVTHPSLPNYIMLASGSTYGVRDDRPPSSHRLRGQSVFGQLAANRHGVRVYAEAQSRSCDLVNHGRYAVRHNPWTYFSDPAERARCQRYDLPLGSTSAGALRTDVAKGALPRYSMVVPDLCNDAHDCRLARADAWLRSWLTRIKAGPDFQSGRLAVVVTFDEDDLSADNRIAAVVLAAQLNHRVVSTRMTHASLAAAPSRLLGLPPLRGGAGTPDFLEAFGLT